MSETLRGYILARGLEAGAVLNWLQEHGVISDLCVTVEDVGNGGQAVAWLEREMR